MSINSAVFYCLFALLYGLICVVLLATGRSEIDCIVLLGWPIGAYLGISIILVISRMLVIAASSYIDGKDPDHPKQTMIKCPRLPEWVYDFFERAGSAGMTILDLLPIFRKVLIITTPCVGVLAGVIYLFNTTGPRLVEDLFNLIGEVAGLWGIYAACMVAISAIERAGITPARAISVRNDDEDRVHHR